MPSPEPPGRCLRPAQKPPEQAVVEGKEETNSGFALKIRFASDSPLEETRFEPVWGFSCQVSFSFGAGSLFGAGKPFFVPSPAIRFAERAEGVKGPKR